MLRMGLLTQTKLSKNLTTVPEPVRNYLELEPGDQVEWHIEDGEIIFRKNSTDETDSD